MMLNWHRRNAKTHQRRLQREIAVRQQAIEVLKGYRFTPEEGRTVMVQMGATPFGGVFFGGRGYG